MPYILIVESKEARSGSPGNPVMTKEGEKFLVEIEPEGWVEATSSHWGKGQNATGIRAMVFKTPEEAAKFAKRWKGHPWWCIPNGKFEVLEVEPNYTRSLTGWKLRK